MPKMDGKRILGVAIVNADRAAGSVCGVAAGFRLLCRECRRWRNLGRGSDWRKIVIRDAGRRRCAAPRRESRGAATSKSSRQRLWAVRRGQDRMVFNGEDTAIAVTRISAEVDRRSTVREPQWLGGRRCNLDHLRGALDHDAILIPARSCSIPGRHPTPRIVSEASSPRARGFRGSVLRNT